MKADIIKLLSKNIGLTKKELETKTFKQLKLDSLDHVEICLIIEEEYGIPMDDDLIGSVKCINDVVYVVQIALKDAEIKKMMNAIHNIAPWLSASINDDSCKEYVAVCDEIFKIDLGIKQGI